jgi:hypothetical protein
MEDGLALRRRHASSQRISALTLPSQKRTRLKVIGESLEQFSDKFFTFLPERLGSYCIERVPAHIFGALTMKLESTQLPPKPLMTLC